MAYSAYFFCGVSLTSILTSIAPPSRAPACVFSTPLSSMEILLPSSSSPGRGASQVTAKAGGLELDKLSVSTEVTKKVCYVASQTEIFCFGTGRVWTCFGGAEGGRSPRESPSLSSYCSAPPGGSLSSRRH